MFDNFPKTRTTLPKEIEEIYTAHYKANREGQTTATSLAKRMESWLHWQVAKDVNHPQNSTKATLELGAGTLNQLQYEPNVHTYDIVEPFTELYESSPLLGKIRNVYADISEVPGNARYDRITSVATLEHVCNLPQVIAGCGLRLTENGVLRTSIPSEGTLLWFLSWRLITGVEYWLKYRLDYGILMRYEHVNTAKEIEEVLNYFFEEVTHKVLGISKALSFYQYYECHQPRIERCRAFAEISNL